MSYTDQPADVLEALAEVGVVPLEQPDVSLEPSDRYSTPPWLVALVAELFGGIDCDPFADPTSSVVARQQIDARRGGNGYRDTWHGRTALVNGAYSGKMPQRTADRCHQQFLRGHQIFNICPAAIGSTYWDRSVWPVAAAVVCLGRVAFPAGVDVYNKKGELVCPAGVALGGNRTEIAGVYSGPDVLRVRRIFEHRGRVVVPS